MFNSKNGILYFQPEDIDDVKRLIQSAVDNHKTIIIQGAKHSFPFSTEVEQHNAGCLYVLLTYMNKIIASDFEKGIFTVQAGCRLGHDPFDETGVSTLENSLVFQLDPLLPNGTRSVPPGWSLPELGGITHQAIGGFVGTGSAGGSTRYAFCDAISAIRILYYDGKNIVDETFKRPPIKDDSDPFWAVGYANLGLLGFVVEITFICQRAFNVRGSEKTTQPERHFIDIKNTATKQSLHSFLKQPDYTRLLWWPQKQINKLLVWSASQETITDWPNYKPHPYHSLPVINGSTQLANKVFGAIFHFLGHTLVIGRQFILKHFTNTPSQKQSVNQWFDKLDILILKLVLKIVAPNGEKQFDDAWWRALPMDNEYSDKFAPVKFTELWIPISQTDEVMKRLNEFYEKPENSGTFCSEIYPGKANCFWLSPGYGTDTIRVDVFWFGRNFGPPEDYFAKFWKLFDDMHFRCHWGKYIGPSHDRKCQELIRRPYPRWEDFMELRFRHDPKGIFLNDYWKKQLDLQSRSFKVKPAIT
ncbi:MAG: FAD-binding protein [Chitinophagaceae bacterium]|nr:FAD-binding protein [Chitinophagaceae bacterium]